MTNQEHIVRLQQERAEAEGDLRSIQRVADAASGGVLTEEQNTAFDQIDQRIQQIDAELKRRERLAELESRQAARQAEADRAADENGDGAEDGNRRALRRDAGGAAGTTRREPHSGIHADEAFDSGLLIPAMAVAMYRSGNDRASAARIARNDMQIETLARLLESPPDMVQRATLPDFNFNRELQRADPGVGDTVTAGYAAEFASWRRAADQWVDLLRNASIAMRLAGQRLLAFGGDDRIYVPKLASGTNGGWIGQGGAIKVTNVATDELMLSPKKVASIVVVTNELLVRSNPSMLMVLRDDMVRNLAELIDTEYVSTNAPGVAPGGIYVGGFIGTGTTAVAEPDPNKRVSADLLQMKQPLDDANVPEESRYWLFNTRERNRLLHITDSLGNYVFRDEVRAGELDAYPLIVSNTVTAGETGLVAADQVMYANGRGPAVDVSDQATIHRDDAPDENIGGATEPVQSLWQTDSAGVRSIQEVDWSKRWDEATALLTAVDWDPTS